MKKTIGYIRISSDRRAQTGVGLQAQQEQIEEMAVVQNLNLIEIK
jgi:hypothetical protein